MSRTIVKTHWREILNIVTIAMALISLFGVPFVMGQKYERICARLDEADAKFLYNERVHDSFRGDIGALRDGYIKQHGWLK